MTATLNRQSRLSM